MDRPAAAADRVRLVCADLALLVTRALQEAQAATEALEGLEGLARKARTVSMAGTVAGESRAQMAHPAIPVGRVCPASQDCPDSLDRPGGTAGQARPVIEERRARWVQRAGRAR